MSNLTGADSPYAWKKDIVLEEVGNVTSSTRISQKVDLTALNAVNFSSSSLAFVAAAYDINGKYFESTEWLNFLILFDLVEAYNDTLIDDDGSPNTLIGQRGADSIRGTGLLIGDAGTNTILQNTDIPRIYQIYRIMSAPEETGYFSSPAVADFGIVFEAFYNLFPSQYNTIEYLSSITDGLIALDDLQSGSNLLRDFLKISAIPTNETYYVQPLLRLTPGFTRATQHMHGNDKINTTAGDSIVIGDDIRGCTPFDLDNMESIGELKGSINDLVFDLSVRVTVMEVDVGFYLKSSNMESSLPYNISVGCDSITTSSEGLALVTGDNLLMYGRTILGDILGPDQTADPKQAKLEPDMLKKAKNIINWFFDIELALVNTNLALYELHSALLREMTIGTSSSTLPLHSLNLGNDEVSSYGNGDTVVGDSTVLFAQVDRPGDLGFSFKAELWDALATAIDKNVDVTRGTVEKRKDYRDNHIEFLDVSAPLTNQELNSLQSDDVPMLLRVGCDTLTQYGQANLGVGDYSFIGFVRSSTAIYDTSLLAKYGRSIESVQRRLLQNQVGSSRILDVPFYQERYDSATSKAVVPTYFSDVLTGNTVGSILLGDVFAGFGYNQIGQQTNAFSINTFPSGNEAPIDSGAPDGFFNFLGVPGPNGLGDVGPDVINVLAGGLADGQLGKDFIKEHVSTIPLRRRQLEMESRTAVPSSVLSMKQRRIQNKRVDGALIEPLMEKLHEHSIISQWIQDVYDIPILRTSLEDNVIQISPDKTPDPSAAVLIPESMIS